MFEVLLDDKEVTFSKVRLITGVLSGSRVPSTIPLSGGSSVIISFSERESANNASPPRLVSKEK